MSLTRTKFPAVPEPGLCWGFYQDPVRNMQQGTSGFYVTPGWAPCQKPLGHLGKCGERASFDAEVERLGERGCHVVHPGQQSLFV